MTPAPVDASAKLIQMIGGLVLQLATAEARIEALLAEQARLVAQIKALTAPAADVHPSYVSPHLVAIEQGQPREARG